MNVAFLNQYARPSGSAGITRHADIGDALDSRGHRVTIVASAFDYLTRRSDPANDDTSATRFRFVRTGTYGANDRRRVLSMIRYAVAATWEAVRLRPRPDVIVGSSPHLLAGVAAWAAAFVLRRPWVLEVRDFWPSALVDLGGIARGGLTHRALEWLERQLYLSAAAIVSVPPNGDLRVAELGVRPADLVHIPNASRPQSGDLRLIPSTLREILEAVLGRFLVVYTGALGMAHGLDTVVEALVDLESRHTSESERLALIFIGDGVQRDPIQRATRDLGLANVWFHDAVPKEVIPAILVKAHACLMLAGPHDYFRFGLSPNKMFDYFAAGKPVLISAANPTVVDEAGAGIRFAPGDPKGMADAIVQMMNLPQGRRDQMGAAGRELVRNRYSISAVADQYEDLLARVVSNRAG